jgi:hypothetical protein
MNKCLYNARSANPKYQYIVDGITGLVNIDSIPVVESDAPNACATRDYLQTSVIAYNPDFIWSIEFNNHWAMVAIFAHEVAHHYYGHINRNPTNSQESHQRELDADRFAGYVLRYCNANLDAATRLFDNPLFQESLSHPNRQLRKDSMICGWIDADFEINPQKYAEPQNNFVNFMKGMTIAASVLLVVGIGASFLSE